MPYSTEFLLSAYRTMKTIREFEERCVKEFEGGNVPGLPMFPTVKKPSP